MGKQRSILALIFVLVIAAITILVRVPTQLGLDLRGGRATHPPGSHH